MFQGYADARPHLSTVPSERFPTLDSLALYLDSFPSDESMRKTLRFNPNDQFYNLNRNDPYPLPMSNGGMQFGPFDYPADPSIGYGMTAICRTIDSRVECMVLDVLEESSASIAGVKKGDHITRWNGQPIGPGNVPVSFIDAKQSVELTVQTYGEAPRTLSLSVSPLREELYGIRYDLYNYSNCSECTGKIGYIQFRYQTQWWERMFFRLVDVYTALQNAGVEHVIIDLRADTRGGDVTYAMLRAGINGDATQEGQPAFKNGRLDDLLKDCLNTYVKSDENLVNLLFPPSQGLPGVLYDKMPYLNATGTLKKIDVLVSRYQGSGPEYTAAILQQQFGARVIGEYTMGMAHVVVSVPGFADNSTIFALELATHCNPIFDVREGGLSPDVDVYNNFFDQPFTLGDRENDPLLNKVLTAAEQRTSIDEDEDEDETSRSARASRGTPLASTPMLRLPPLDLDRLNTIRSRPGQKEN